MRLAGYHTIPYISLMSDEAMEWFHVKTEQGVKLN